MDPDRRQALIPAWLRERAGLTGVRLQPVSGDASFRRYYRVTTPEASYILMDAPPEKEDCRPFVRITAVLSDAGLNVPRLFEVDLEQGLLLLGDLGDELFLGHLRTGQADTLYRQALAALCRIQLIEDPGLPTYSRALLMREMALFREWFLGVHLGLELSPEQGAVLEGSCTALAQVAAEQPQVFVHRDYHSRNLMLSEDGSPGILDYQDAVRGPIAYDLVSLLRDSYIDWPREQVLHWVGAYLERARALGLPVPPDSGTLLRWFDLTGVQRQLKVCGIFARLHHRDAKPGYLDDIPRTFAYLIGATAHYPETRPLHRLLHELGVGERLGMP